MKDTGLVLTLLYLLLVLPITMLYKRLPNTMMTEELIQLDTSGEGAKSLSTALRFSIV